MKNILTSLILSASLSLSMASCDKGNKPVSIQENGDSNVTTTNPSTSKMKITIGSDLFTVTLYDNPSVTAFRARLPLTINMTELNGNEKYYDLPNSLPANASVGGNIKVGDLTLYGSNTLVLFYKGFNTSYSYTKLGYVDSPSGLATALGNGIVVVKFENN